MITRTWNIWVHGFPLFPDRKNLACSPFSFFLSRVIFFENYHPCIRKISWKPDDYIDCIRQEVRMVYNNFIVEYSKREDWDFSQNLFFGIFKYSTNYPEGVLFPKSRYLISYSRYGQLKFQTWPYLWST